MTSRNKYGATRGKDPQTKTLNAYLPVIVPTLKAPITSQQDGDDNNKSKNTFPLTKLAYLK